MKGGTTFTFVTDGIESALEQARQAARGKDVLVGGGAEVVQQYLATGLVDEFVLHVVPVLLSHRERLLENLGELKLEQVRADEAPGVTHIKYQVIKRAQAISTGERSFVFGRRQRAASDVGWAMGRGRRHVCRPRNAAIGEAGRSGCGVFSGGH